MSESFHLGVHRDLIPLHICYGDGWVGDCEYLGIMGGGDPAMLLLIRPRGIFIQYKVQKLSLKYIHWLLLANTSV